MTLVATAPAPTVKPGTLLQGGWVVEDTIRMGPTGVELRCHHQDDPMRRATVKVFQDTYPDAWRRFQREAHILTRTQHPNLVRAEAARLRTEPPYLVMQLRDGPDLRMVLARSGALPLLQALRVARDLSSLLMHLHGQAVYHRDLQPANIVLGAQGPLVVEMGIGPEEGFGRLTLPGMRLGDVRYAPPEWASGEQQPAQWDLYALGLTLWAMLTGEEPFDADGSLPESDRAVRLTKRKRATPHLDPGGSLPAAVRALVRQLTDVDPHQRPRTARQVHFQLREIIESLGGDAGVTAGPAPLLPDPADDEPPPSLDAPVVITKPPPPTLVPADLREASEEGQSPMGTAYAPHWMAWVAILLLFALSTSLFGATVATWVLMWWWPTAAP